MFNKICFKVVWNWYEAGTEMERTWNENGTNMDLTYNAHMWLVRKWYTNCMDMCEVRLLERALQSEAWSWRVTALW